MDVPAPTEAATTETTTSVVGTGDAIADALAEYKGPDEGEAQPSASEAAPAKPPAKDPKEAEAEKKPDEQPKDGKKKRQEFEAYLLTEGVLGTKDGIEKASQHFRRRQSKLDGIEVRQSENARAQDDRDSKFQEAYQAASAELDRDRERARVIREWDKKLTEGSIEEMLETLGRMRGKSGREVWDAMARKAIAMGRETPTVAPAEIQRLEARIEQLTAALEERGTKEVEERAEAETQQLSAAVEEKERALITAASDHEKYPELARFVKVGASKNIVAEVVRLKTHARAAGRQLDNAGALAHIEAELKRLPAGATPASPAGAKPASPAAAIADDVRVTGIAPSQTRSAGTVREKTQEERDEDLAKDAGFFRDFFGLEV